jgi:hypothetical protein
VSQESEAFYEIWLDAKPGAKVVGPQAGNGAVRRLIPFAIPYATNHSDKDHKGAIVSGDDNRDTVIPLIRSALTATRGTYDSRVAEFDKVTADTYAKVADADHARGFFAGVFKAIKNAITTPEAQYDPHSQLVIRVTDQFGKPVENFSVYFNSFGGDKAPDQLINKLFEDKHSNDRTPNTINFYLRTKHWNKDERVWKSQLEAIEGVSLEIDAIDPLTQRVLFIPLRLKIGAADLLKWIEPHRTTVIDIQLMRLPHHVTFILRAT